MLNWYRGVLDVIPITDFRTWTYKAETTVTRTKFSS